MINVSVVGLGYVGSAMSIVIADAKNIYKKPLYNVIGLDLENKIGLNRIEELNKFRFPFKTNDKNINIKLKKIKKNNNLKARVFSPEYIRSSSVILLSINFDFSLKKEKMNKNFKNYQNCFREIVKNIKPKSLIIIESTLPPGFIEKKLVPIFNFELKQRKISTKSVFLSYSYERVTPGKNYINSIINNWRVYSGINYQSKKKCKSFLSKIINIKKFPLSELENITAAEISKNMENSYRATNIAFINEWAVLSEKLNVNLNEIINVIKLRPTHSNIMYPGLGVGGYCLTKDPLLPKVASRLIFKSKDLRFNFSENAVTTNNSMPLRSAKLIKSNINDSIRGKKILLCGAAYKDEVDDTRNSPSFDLFLELKRLKTKITVQDPFVEYWKEAKISLLKNIPDFNLFDIIIFATKHTFYHSIVFKKKFKKQIFFDLNNVLSKKQLFKVKSQRLKVFLIGKGFI